MSDYKTLHSPFGFDQGDPLVVCINEVHMRHVQKAFRLKAYYCGPFSAIGGRRHNKVIVFRKDETAEYNRLFEQWLNENVRTCLPPKNEGIIIV